ncbi:MAG: rhodanese-like domain-containing protein [bacterium]|nr:rhodanese-like domain-containing protein [bacterium]
MRKQLSIKDILMNGTENSTQNGLLKKTVSLFKDSFYIVLLAVLIGGMVNLFHPKGFVVVSKAGELRKKIIFLSLEEAKIKYDSFGALIVDSRDFPDYKDLHIKGAINIPSEPDSLSFEKIKAHFSVINGPKELIIYCDAETCGSSETLAKRIQDQGYSRHIYIIKDGLPAWEDAGYDVE